MSRVGTLPKLALVDWGVGGLGVRRAFASLAPGLAVTYVSDSGATPYGLLAPDALAARLGRLVDALGERGVERIFLACNAASTALVRGARFSLPTEGMVDAGVATVLASGARTIGVVGGRRTVTSGVYRRAIAAHGIRVVQRVAQPLSAAVEAGNAADASTVALVQGIVAPLHDADAVLLACTHYPAAMAAFERALPHMRWLDPAGTAARGLLGAVSSLRPGPDVVLTTGDADAMRLAARAAFGMDLRAGRLDVDEGAAGVSRAPSFGGPRRLRRPL